MNPIIPWIDIQLQVLQKRITWYNKKGSNLAQAYGKLLEEVNIELIYRKLRGLHYKGWERKGSRWYGNRSTKAQGREKQELVRDRERRKKQPSCRTGNKGKWEQQMPRGSLASSGEFTFTLILRTTEIIDGFNKKVIGPAFPFKEKEKSVLQWEQTGGREGERWVIHLGGYYRVPCERWHLDQGDGGGEAKWMVLEVFKRSNNRAGWHILWGGEEERGVAGDSRMLACGRWRTWEGKQD